MTMHYSEFLKKYANTRHAKTEFEKKSETQLPPAVENMCCEIYNPGREKNWNPIDYTIRFTSFHETKMNHWFFGLSPKTWLEIECKVGDWVFLPHGQYMASFWRGGREHKLPPNSYQCIVNMGDAMFKGNKLPSRPEAKKIRQFTL
jgi:hypothetical protein